MKGGREYIISASVKDVAGNERIEEIKTPYIRQFEHMGKELYGKGITFGTSYMTGYYPWETGIVIDDLPLLGKYVATDDIVQWKHIDWATGHGIDVFYVDGGFWEE